MYNIKIREITEYLSDYIRKNGVLPVLSSIEVMSQEGVKNDIQENKCELKFKMLSFESTPDNPMNVDIDESKFLNDSLYHKNWISIQNGEPIAYICLGFNNDSIEIKAVEVSSDYRGTGCGKEIANAIESFACVNDYDSITLSPFDTNAEEFWNHMGYEWTTGYKMINRL